MTKAYILDFKGGTAAQYNAVLREMGLTRIGAPAPVGAVFHGAGATATGWRVIDVWEDPSAFDRFAADQIQPLSARHGLGTPAVQVFDVADVRRGSKDEVTFAQFVRIPGLDRAGFSVSTRSSCLTLSCRPPA
jgi:hypothetical protein